MAGSLGWRKSKLNLRVLFKCESLNKKRFSKKATAWVPLMVLNVPFHTLLGLNRGDAGCRANEREAKPNTTEMGERLFLFSQDPMQDLQIKPPRMCLLGRSLVPRLLPGFSGM